MASSVSYNDGGTGIGGGGVLRGIGGGSSSSNVSNASTGLSSSGFGGGGGGNGGGGGGGAVEAVEMDPSFGASFFHADYKKHDDLKQMLDSNKDSAKLEAMRRIVGMVARGRDAGNLFPAVVKNVVSKNIEIKKLVYVYLTRYAEEQQDLALLSISTFQRALKDPNQLIRASALRVLSSIRVSVIAPIVMLSIRDSAVDMSPFVRKTAAHAIPKLYSLDPEQKEELVGVIEKLLGDRTTLVMGSAVMAFEEVCPERIELIHKNFRKLCNLLVDVEEWGQVVIVNMLSRYARTQFTDPNLCDELEELTAAGADKNFYENSDEEDEREEAVAEKQQRGLRPKMDPDHRLLLKSTKPLLQSRNASVVMATAQLYHHCAPKAEVQAIAKAMIRLLRSHKEVQAIILNCIASMTSSRQRNSMFEPFLRNFFVRSSDPTHIKILKLEVITNMASESNIGLILREFQSYITGQDKICVAATIQAIGRCAAAIEEVTDTCLNGLVHLLSNRDQAVVAESVVVIKKLLQTQSGDHKEIIIHMAKLVDTIEVPAARAAILWVLGEYSGRVPKIAPDVLRKMAKTFVSETPEVKMQILNLAAKLCLTNPKQTTLLSQYVFNLARYDQNYDLRDRARFMRAFIFPPQGQEENQLVKHAKKIFLATKPAPVTESKFKDREVFQLGSLSHFLNARATGYQDLPEYPAEPPDPTVRNVEPPPPKVLTPWEQANAAKNQKAAGDKRKGSGFGSKGGIDISGTSDSSSSSSSSGSESDSEDSGSEKEEPTVKKTLRKPETNGGLESQHKVDGKSSSSSDSESSSSSSTSDSGDQKSRMPGKNTVPAARPNPPKSNLDLLLDFSDDVPASATAPMLTPSMGGFLSPDRSSNSKASIPDVAGSSTIHEASAAFVQTKATELLSRMSTGGLQVLYRYTRSPHLYSPSMANVELTLTNLGDADLADIKVGAKSLAPGMALHEFPGLASIPVGATACVNVGINFNDTTQAVKFDLVASGRCYSISINPIVGELVRAVQMPENTFNSEQSKLRGMNETNTSVNLPSANASEVSVRKKVYEAANVLQVPSSSEGVLKFAGQTLASKSLVLVAIKLTDSADKAEVVINCEKIVIGSMLSKEIKKHLEMT